MFSLFNRAKVHRPLTGFSVEITPRLNQRHKAKLAVDLPWDNTLEGVAAFAAPRQWNYLPKTRVYVWRRKCGWVRDLIRTPCPINNPGTLILKPRSGVEFTAVRRRQLHTIFASELMDFCIRSMCLDLQEGSE